MLRNYFTVAWRNLWKNKTFSFINIFGLSIGLACCILIFLFIQHELSYDKYNVNADRIFRIVSKSASAGDKTMLAVTPAPWVPLMKKDYPEIRNYVRLLKTEKSVIGQDGKQQFYETELYFADSTFFDVFTIGLAKGNKNLVLDRPNTVVLSKEASDKYFGKEDPIGKTLVVNAFGRTLNVEVTGIVNEIPSASHFKFNLLVSMRTLGDMSGFWSYHMMQSYVLLAEKSSSSSLEAKFPDFVNKYIVGNTNADGKHDIYLQPVTKIHLHSNMVGELEPNSDISYVYIFACVAIFILLIACFNFTNLSTARSLSRAKEVGLRKVVGALKNQLMNQFLSEALLFALIALLIGIGLVVLVLPVFNELSGRVLSFSLAGNYLLIATLVALVFFVGIISGLYPAVVLSAFRPVEILKSKFKKSGRGVSFRKALITLQFVISITLISSTIIVSSQLRYLKNKDLGFDKENVAIITLPRDADTSKLQTFRNQLLNTGVIGKTAVASSIPGTFIPINQVNDGNTDLTKAISMQMLFADEEFVSTMNFKVVAGRNFSVNYGTDRSAGFILNEEAVKKMGWRNSEEAIGKTLQWVFPNEVVKSGKVIGVVRDFNITPLRSAVQPLVIHYLPNRFQYLYARFNQANAKGVVGLIEKRFKEVYPNQSFEYGFLDDTLNNMYQSEQRTGKIFSYFTFLAILIACLGILGLSLYSIQQRVKEIGIKKVLGASIFRITNEIIKEFVKPVLVAAIIAIPIASFAMNKWLEEFAYRTSVQWWVFAIAALIALAIAVLTVGFQATRAALSNPVKALRSE